jgi:hypothetical protein
MILLSVTPRTLQQTLSVKFAKTETYVFCKINIGVFLLPMFIVVSLKE